MRGGIEERAKAVQASSQAPGSGDTRGKEADARNQLHECSPAASSAELMNDPLMWHDSNLVRGSKVFVYCFHKIKGAISLIMLLTTHP